MKSFLGYAVIVAAMFLLFLFTAGVTGVAVKFWFDVFGD